MKGKERHASWLDPQGKRTTCSGGEKEAEGEEELPPLLDVAETASSFDFRYGVQLARYLYRALYDVSFLVNR